MKKPVIYLLGWSHGEYEDHRDGVICASADPKILEAMIVEFGQWLIRKKKRIPARANADATIDEWSEVNDRRQAFLKKLREPFPYAKHCVEYDDAPDFSVYPVPLK